MARLVSGYFFCFKASAKRNERNQLEHGCVHGLSSSEAAERNFNGVQPFWVCVEIGTPHNGIPVGFPSSHASFLQAQLDAQMDPSHPTPQPLNPHTHRIHLPVSSCEATRVLLFLSPATQTKKATLLFEATLFLPCFCFYRPSTTPQASLAKKVGPGSDLREANFPRLRSPRRPCSKPWSITAAPGAPALGCRRPDAFEHRGKGSHAESRSHFWGGPEKTPICMLE